MDLDALEEAFNALSFKHKGIYFESRHTSPEEVEAVEDMKIRDSDVFLVTYRKSGTVWTQQILSLIFNEGHRNGTEHVDTWLRMPWIEYDTHEFDFKSRPSPRLFTSHLPYYLMPSDVRFRMGKSGTLHEPIIRGIHPVLLSSSSVDIINVNIKMDSSSDELK
ncbi:hypothetical protein GDO78_018220 [Eleutherodactylus coqui]|uniref:Sulfotransferase n=1 Tax=Eleutherodactylus coqui TaxID=57060 RepID=A0A8J6BKM7_ELECQ|nr:hypothetical protein GDO78_018220 [Eleutherodactylus coqui]